MGKSIISTLVAVIAIGAVIYLKVNAASNRSEKAQAEMARLDTEWSGKTLAILKNAGSNPKLKESAKWVNGEWKYIESVFPPIHAQALDDATLTGRRGDVTFDQFQYLSACFKGLAAKALADRKNELSAAIEKIGMATPKMDTSDWKPLPGSNPRPRG